MVPVRSGLAWFSFFFLAVGWDFFDFFIIGMVWYNTVWYRPATGTGFCTESANLGFPIPSKDLIPSIFLFYVMFVRFLFPCWSFEEYKEARAFYSPVLN